jgi:hypothetical protein
MAKYKIHLLCRNDGGEDVHCYITEGKSDREAKARAVEKCKTHYPEFEEITVKRKEYVGI